MEDTPEYKEWLAWMKKYNPSANRRRRQQRFTATAAQTMVAVLKACGDNLTRENMMKQAASLKDLTLPMLLPGIKVTTSADRFRPDQADAVDAVRRQDMGAVRRRDLGEVGG